MLQQLAELSNRYGSDKRYVLAGGGNTSAKNDTELFVKGSGSSLATIKATDFVGMDRLKLNAMLEKEYPTNDEEREAAALKDLMAARLPGVDKRPSVETPLHNLFPYKFVLHVHPALVNGLTCGKDGETLAKQLFQDSFVWIPLFRPGYALSMLCYEKMQEHKAQTGNNAQILLLQNHGVFVAADTVSEIDLLMKKVMDTLQSHVIQTPDMSAVPFDEAFVASIKEQIRTILKTDHVGFSVNKEILNFVQTPEAFFPLSKPFTPDHIVYCKAEFLYLSDAKNIATEIAAFNKKNGYTPRVICIKGVGAFFAAATENELTNVELLFADAVCVAVYSQSFGGPLHMTEELIHFILNWEAEAYRQQVAKG